MKASAAAATIHACLQPRADVLGDFRLGEAQFLLHQIGQVGEQIGNGSSQAGISQGIMCHGTALRRTDRLRCAVPGGSQARSMNCS